MKTILTDKTAFITRSGNIYFYTGTKPQAVKGLGDFSSDPTQAEGIKNVWYRFKEKPFIIRTWGPYDTYMTYTVEKVSLENSDSYTGRDFLAVRFYHAVGRTLKDWQADKSIRLLTFGHHRSYLYSPRYTECSELRIRDDGMILKLFYIEFEDGPRWLVPNLMAELPDNGRLRIPNLSNDPDFQVKINSTDSEGQRCYKLLTMEQYKKETCKDFYGKNTRKSKLLYPSIYTGTDARKGYLIGMTQICRDQVEHVKFTPETAQIVADFFRINRRWGSKDDTWVRLRAAYVRSSHKEQIENFEDLITYTYGDAYKKPNNKSEETQETKRNEIENKIANGTYYFDETVSKRLILDRQGDDVVITLFHTADAGNYNHRRREKVVFIYNTMTKKRTLAIATSGGIELQIPSEAQIMQLLDSTPERRYVSSGYINGQYHSGHYERGEYYPPLFRKPFEEVFKGTNVMALKEYVKDDIRLDYLPASIYTNDDYYYRGCVRYGRAKTDEEKSEFSLNWQLSPEHFNNFGIRILNGSSKPFAEQMIKSKLTNLYLLFLQVPDVFVNIKKFNKEGFSTYHLDWDVRGHAVLVKPEAKNLKKAFTMTIEQLRILDAMVGEAMAARQEESTALRDCMPPIYGFQWMLKEAMMNIDIKTFKEVMEKFKTYIVGGENVSAKMEWSVLSKDNIMALTTNMSPKQKYNFIVNMDENIVNTYDDYLRMRGQLERLSQVKNDPSIFDPRQYPVKVTECVKFFRYRIGERIGYRTVSDESSFKQALDYKLGDYSTHLEQEEVRDQDGKLIGVLVPMTVRQHMKYLHDDCQFWVTLYQDEVKQKEFELALKRVEHLEYEDKKTGLRIVAPRRINDLKNEGSTLSHCVASFVDPIINNTENVLFIRQGDCPDVPYYTIAISNAGEIEQIHCFRNGDLTEEGQQRALENSKLCSYEKKQDLIAFLKRWATATQGWVKAATIRLSYGALCARR